MQVQAEVNRQANSSKKKLDKLDRAYLARAGPTTTLQGVITV